MADGTTVQNGLGLLLERIDKHLQRSELTQAAELLQIARTTAEAQTPRGPDLDDKFNEAINSCAHARALADLLSVAHGHNEELLEDSITTVAQLLRETCLKVEQWLVELHNSMWSGERHG